MLPKQERLTKAGFDRSFWWKRLHTPELQVIYHSPPLLPPPQWLEEVFKSAVKRNRLRQQIYGAMEQHFGAKRLIVVIVVAKPAMAAVPKAVSKIVVNALLQILHSFAPVRYSVTMRTRTEQFSPT